MTLIDSTALSERMMPLDGADGTLNASGFSTAWIKPSAQGAKRLVAMLVVTGVIPNQPLVLKFRKASDAAGTGGIDLKVLTRAAHATNNDNAILMLDLDHNELPRDVDQAGAADKPYISCSASGGAAIVATGALVVVAGDLADTPEAGAGRSAHITEIKRN